MQYYFKMLNGKTFWRGSKDGFGVMQDSRYPEYFIGDKDGNPVGGTSWSVHCKSQWNDTESGEEKRRMGGGRRGGGGGERGGERERGRERSMDRKQERKIGTRN